MQFVGEGVPRKSIGRQKLVSLCACLLLLGRELRLYDWYTILLPEVLDGVREGEVQVFL